MKFEHTVSIDAEKCIGCGLCRDDCPTANIAVEGGKARAVSQECIMCGHCLAICPRVAVSLSGFDEEPRELEEGARLVPDELLRALAARRSIRRFARDELEDGVVERIVEAGRLAPSGGNAQDVSFIVLRDGLAEAERSAVRLFRRLLPLARLASPLARRTAVDDRFFFKGAPAAIVVTAREPVDGALAAANMALMAEACGLGVLYSGFFSMAANSSPALRRMLGLERGRKVAATLVLGRPAVAYRRTAPKEPASVRFL